MIKERKKSAIFIFLLIEKVRFFSSFGNLGFAKGPLRHAETPLRGANVSLRRAGIPLRDGKGCLRDTGVSVQSAKNPLRDTNDALLPAKGILRVISFSLQAHFIYLWR